MYRHIALLLLVIPSLCFAQQLPDPTRPPARIEITKEAPKEKEIQTQAQFVLSAVLYSKDRCVAVINGQLLQTGDTINGYTLTKIEPNKIQLKGFNETQEIPLITEEIRLPIKKNVK